MKAEHSSPTRRAFLDGSLAGAAGLVLASSQVGSAVAAPDRVLSPPVPSRDRVSSVHVEIHRSPTGTPLTPTVDAWNIPSEPWLFTIEGSGVIHGRLDGAFGGNEMRTLLDGIAR